MTTKIAVAIQAEDEELIPKYATEFASGCDVKANILHPVTIHAHSSQIIPTGIKVAVPVGFEIQVRPRSGFAAKHQITVLNTPGTIDCDYRGEICVILMNHSNQDFVVTPKMRIAQLVLAPVVQAEFIQEELSMTLRGEGKFGHTGSH